MSNVTTMQQTAPASQSAGFGSLTPKTLDEAMRFADLLSKSSIVPKDYQGNPGNVLVAVQWGNELGLQPLQAMQNIAVINGRPSIWGDAMLAIVQGSGLLEYIKEDPQEDGCTCIVKRKGQPAVERSFTMKDAQDAGLARKQGPWTQYPKRMMQMRARGFALRDAFADVLRGVSIAEEVIDAPREMRDVTPAESQDEPKTKTQSVKDKIRAKKEAASATSIEDVLGLIEAAIDHDALKAAGAKAKELTSDDDKERAREAYRTKASSLDAKANDDHIQAAYRAIIASVMDSGDVSGALDYYEADLNKMEAEAPELYASLMRDIDAAKGGAA